MELTPEQIELYKHPLRDGVTTEQCKALMMPLVMHPKAFRKQDLRALCIRLIATLLWERGNRQLSEKTP